MPRSRARLSSKASFQIREIAHPIVTNAGVKAGRPHAASDGPQSQNSAWQYLPLGDAASAAVEVRKTSSWPRSWAKLQPFIAALPQECMAKLHRLSQPNSFLARDPLAERARDHAQRRRRRAERAHGARGAPARRRPRLGIRARRSGFWGPKKFSTPDHVAVSECTAGPPRLRDRC
jgi:hypothetical protein